MNPFLGIAYQLYRLRWRITRPITVGVRMMLVKHERVLLVRHSYQREWHFPGGGVKRGETPRCAASREAYEEAGAIVQTEPKLMGVYANFGEGKSDHIFTYFSADFALTEPTDRWEISALGLFAFDALPRDISRGCLRRIREFIEGGMPYSELW